MGKSYTPADVHEARQKIFDALSKVLMERAYATMPKPSDGFDPRDHPGYSAWFTGALNEYLDQQVDQLLNMFDINAIRDRTVHLRDASADIREDQQIHTDIKAALDLIDDWEGVSADGAETQLRNFQGYLNEKLGPIAAVAATYSALGRLTVSTWGSYCELADATEAACDQAIAKVDDARQEFAVAQAMTIAKSILQVAADPKNIVSVAIDFVFDTAGDGKDASDGVDNALDKVVESYDDCFHKLWSRFTIGVNETIRSLETVVADHLSKQPALEDPDNGRWPRVTEPNFDYEMFRPVKDGPRDPAAFKVKVKKVTAQDGSGTNNWNSNSEISQRLAGNA